MSDSGSNNLESLREDVIPHGGLDVPPPGAIDGTPEDRRNPRKWSQFPRVVVIWYTLAFIAAEALGAYVGVQWQLIATSVLLVAALNHALFGYRNARTAAVVMSALFTARLVVLAMPLNDTSVATRTGVFAIIAIVISRLAVWVMAHDVHETRRNEGFELKRPVLSANFTTGLVALSGIPLGFAAYALLDPAELVPGTVAGSLIAAWIIVIGFLILGAFADELLYRQLVAAMVQHTGGSQTPIFAGLIYGSIFLSSGNLAFAGLAALVGVWFAWSCERTGSLSGPIAAHAIINVLVFVVLPAF